MTSNDVLKQIRMLILRRPFILFYHKRVSYFGGFWFITVFFTLYSCFLSSRFNIYIFSLTLFIMCLTWAINTTRDKWSVICLNILSASWIASSHERIQNHCRDLNPKRWGASGLKSSTFTTRPRTLVRRYRLSEQSKWDHGNLQIEI
jgi:hypothetical protein